MVSNIELQQTEDRRVIFPLWAQIVILGLSMVKLWLASGQTLTALSYLIQDDQLFIKLASHILDGQWLGPYDNLTLVKGPFYPLWIAGSFVLDIPLLRSQQILYAFACLMMVAALKPLLRRPVYAVILYAVLLFDPMSYASIYTRVLRDHVYSSLTLLIVACSVGLLLNRAAQRLALQWSIGLGLSLSCFWLTREESLWIVPFVSFMAFFYAVFAIRERTMRVMLANWSLVFMIWLVGVLLVSGMNYRCYGVFVVNEMEASSFRAAYGALARVKNEHWVPYLFLSRESRARIYAISPAFAELEPYLEVHGKKWWAHAGTFPYYDDLSKFSWAFRDAVQWAGYYHNNYPDEYYRRLAAEVNKACNSAELECAGSGSALLSAKTIQWRSEYLPLTIRTMLEKTRIVVAYNYVDAFSERVTDNSDVDLFRVISGERLTNDVVPSRRTRWMRFRIWLLNRIVIVYRYLYGLLLISLGMFLYLVYGLIRFRKDLAAIVVLASLVLLCVARIGLISYLSVTSWEYWGYLYLNCIYPAMLVFACLGPLLVIEQFLSVLRRIGPRFLKTFPPCSVVA